MIKIDYLLKRDEGDKFTEFRPDKSSSSLPVLAYVQKPNATGKSTLLNLIALGFFGLNLSNEELNPDLRERVEALVNSNHQNVKFNIEVENEMLGVKFILEKKDLDKKLCVVRKIENGKEIPISEETFRREYKLIYDIPNDPLGRLPLLLYTLRDQQKEIGADIANLRGTIWAIISDIKESKDPELIKKMKQRIKENQNNYEIQNKNVIEMVNKCLKIKEYFYARFLAYYQNEVNDTSERIEGIRRRINREKRNQSQEYKAHLVLSRNLEDNIQKIEALVETIKPVLQKLIDKGQKQRLKLWKSEEIRNVINHPDIYPYLRSESEYFAKELKGKILEERSKISQDLEKKNLLKTLVAILIDYKDNDITIPGANLPIGDFIETLSENLEQLEEITSRVDNVDQCAQELERLIKLIDNAIETAQKIKEHKDFSEDEFENFSLMQEIVDLNTRQKTYKDKLKELRNGAINNGVNPDELEGKYINLAKDPDVKFYETYNENQINEKISDLEKKFTDLQDNCEKLKRRVDDEREDLARFEAKKPHKYQNKFAEIQKLLVHIQNLEKLFHSYDDWLSKIIASPSKMKKLSKEEIAYIERIGIYLAKKIGKIKYIDKFYNVKNIDVISKKLSTEEGTIIHFSDLSTGQGQAAYLETLLSMNENKKVIALFDEVAMMDENTLKPIKDKLRRLYNEKKLLMAIIVQKSNEVKVENLL
jgi:DNA repair protein SbcC/Rad50